MKCLKSFILTVLLLWCSWGPLLAVELASGWNLIGSQSISTTAADFFAARNFSSNTQPFTRVWGWDNVNSQWKIYSIIANDDILTELSGTAELTQIESERGYWIHTTASVTFEYTPDSSSSGDFTLSSVAIANGELLATYKCEQKVNNIEQSIPLAWSNVPASTGSLAIIMHHFPNPNDTTQANSYLLLWGIDPSITEIAHGAADDGNWYMGANKDGNAISYTSPCSPSAGSHEYTITVYALSQTPSSLPTSSSLDVDYVTLKAAIETVTVIGTATLTFNDVNT